MADETPSCMDVVDVLDGFFYLRKRSPTLHGDAPVRAVQACPPFSEGSAFGYEVRYSGIGIALEPEAPTPVRMLDEMTPGFDYAATVNRAAPYLSPAWLDRLLTSWWWRDGTLSDRLHVWTGLLVRPQPGHCARLGELHNSPHLRLDIAEQIALNDDTYTPLVLTVDVLSVPDQPRRTALAGAVACLSPLPANATMASAPIGRYPECGKRLLDYYDDAYFQEKLTAPPTRKYARLLREPEPEAIGFDTDALILNLDPENEDADIAPIIEQGPYVATLHAPADIALTFLGRGFHVSMGPGWEERWAAAHRQWQNLYGPDGARYHEAMTFDGESCVHTTPGHPALIANIEPLQRFAARPGWALLFEACSKTLRWGLRGCIRSSRFHAGVFAFQWFDRAEDTLIPAGAPLGRVIPIPQELLDASISVRPLDV